MQLHVISNGCFMIKLKNLKLHHKKSNKPFALNGGREQCIPGVLEVLDVLLHHWDPLGGRVPLDRLSPGGQHLQLDLLFLTCREQGLGTMDVRSYITI